MNKLIVSGTQAGPNPPAQIIDLPVEDSEEPTFADVLTMLRRRVLLIVTTVGLVVAGASAFAFLATPRYTASGQIVIDGGPRQISSPRSVVADAPADSSDVPNEIAVLQSRALAATVIRELGLEADPEFNEALRAEGTRLADLFPWLAQRIDTAFGVLAESGTAVLAKVFGPADEPAQEELRFDPAQIKIVDAFLQRLEATAQSQLSRVVDVRFTSSDPEKAARVVNALMEAYLAAQVEQKQAATRKAADWLERMLEELRSDMAVAEGAVQAFREQTKLVETSGANVTSQQVAELNSRLVQARADEAAAAARLKQVRSLLKTPDSIAAAPEVLSSPLIQRLREQEMAVLRRTSELSARYGEKHPKMIEVRAELRDLRKKVNSEVSKIVESLTNEVAIARARVAALQAGLSRLEGEAIEVNKAESRLRELQREADTIQDLYQEFLVRYQETSAQLAIAQPDARVVSFAAIPLEVSFPKKGRIIGFSFVGSIVLGICMAFVVSALDRGLEDPETIQRTMQRPSLGLLPHVPKISNGFRSPEAVIRQNPWSPYGEAVQRVRTSLFLCNNQSHPKTLLVTSIVPGEGKTTFALSYAYCAARMGQNVIILDCDLGNPALHKRLHNGNQAGIAEVLLGSAGLQDVIHSGGASQIDVICAGRLPGNATELLGSPAMRDLLETLSWNYDLILIDSSPVLALKDTQVLARLAEATVMLVRWRHTSRELLKEALRQLDEAGVTSVRGFVLSRVRLSKLRNDAYGYYGKYRRYARGLARPHGSSGPDEPPALNRTV